jgi:hypothetical protein
MHLLALIFAHCNVQFYSSLLGNGFLGAKFRTYLLFICLITKNIWSASQKYTWVPMIMQSTRQTSLGSLTETLLQWTTIHIQVVYRKYVSVITEEWFVLRSCTFHMTRHHSSVLVTHDVTDALVFQESSTCLLTIYCYWDMNRTFILIHRHPSRPFCSVYLEWLDFLNCLW